MTTRQTSAIFTFAAKLRRDMMREYDRVRQAEYEAALEATQGVMLNDRGRATPFVTAERVFLGTPNVVAAYASPELHEYLRDHPRTAREDFEAEWLQGMFGDVL